MTILIIAAAFIAIAILVALVAMRAGPKKGPEPSGGNAGFAIFMVLIVVFGLGAPAYALVNNADTSPTEGKGGVELTSAQSEGRDMFIHNCATCHTLADAGSTGMVGPNLDELRPPKALVVNAIQNGRAQGNGQMPAGLVAGDDAANIGDYVSAVAGR